VVHAHIFKNEPKQTSIVRVGRPLAAERPIRHTRTSTNRTHARTHVEFFNLNTWNIASHMPLKHLCLLPRASDRSFLPGILAPGEGTYFIGITGAGGVRKNVRRAKARGTPFRSRRGWSGVQLAAVGAGPGRARVTKEQSKLLTDDFPTHIPQCGEIYFFY
jgi:hypothetical protein